jgi:hypothetical protein
LGNPSEGNNIACKTHDGLHKMFVDVDIHFLVLCQMAQSNLCKKCVLDLKDEGMEFNNLKIRDKNIFLKLNSYISIWF